MRLVRLIVAMKKKELTKKSTEQLNCSDNLNINGPVNHKRIFDIKHNMQSLMKDSVDDLNVKSKIEN